jgi:hypothetical protein
MMRRSLSPSLAWTLRLLLFVMALGVAAQAGAQIAPSGPTTLLRYGVVRGIDVAFDPETNTYMYVGAQNNVYAVCTNASGTPTTGIITIKASATQPPSSPLPFGSFPRVMYSTDLNGGAGAFLVVWQSEEPPGTPAKVQSRVVSCSAGVLGTEQTVSGTLGAWTDFGGLALGYSPVSQKFLVVWKKYPTVKMYARLVDLNGAPVGDPVVLNNEFGRDPSIVWNSTLNEFGVSFSGESNVGGYLVFARMPADNPAAFTRNTFGVTPGALQTITDLAYNPVTERYLMAWWQGAGGLTKVTEIDSTGNLVTMGTISTIFGSYDALSVAYNPNSGTFALLGIDRVYDHAQVNELNSRGYKFTNDITIESGTFTIPNTVTVKPWTPIRYPRIKANIGDKTWMAALNGGNYALLADQLVVTTSSGGGPAGEYPPPGSGCQYTLNPISGTEPSTGGTGSFTVTTTAGCTWTATPSAAWVHVTSGAAGNGNGTVIYTADANSGASRSATITVGGSSYTVNQPGTGSSCTYSLNPTSGTEPAVGGTGSFTVTATTGCTWTATPSASWVTITSGASGSGNGTVSYAAAANSGSARSATITVGDQTYTVNQPAPAVSCSYALNPTSSGAIVAAGGSGTFDVTTTSGCTWTAATTASWIHITAGGSGSASGTVSYSVDANISSARTDTITLGGQSFTVTQDAYVAAPGCTLVTVQAKPTPPPSGGVTGMWQSTGITLTAGQGVTISASGTWVDAGVSYSPAGHASTTLTGTNCPLPGAKLMALVGRIGTNGTPFVIGATTTFTPSSTGVLYLAPQDNWYATSDNSGSLNVLVCLDLQPSCDFALSPASSGTIVSGGGSDSFTVTTGTGCTWTAATSSSWIHITSGSGTSSGTVSYTVDANAGASRTGTITVDNQTYTVSQEAAGPVTTTTVPVLAKPTPPAGVGGVETLWQSSGVTLTAGQPVTIAATGTWVDGGVSYTAAGHGTTTVTGTNCPLSGQKLMALIGRIGTSGTPFLIGTTLSFTPGTSGVLYLAPQDNWYTTWDNSGSLSVAISVTSGSCTYSLSPTSSGTVASTGGSSTFSVTTGGSCTWTPTPSDSWIHITSGNGPGSGTVAYSVDVNSGSARSGSITVGDQTFAVSQAADGAASCNTATVQAKPTPPPGTGGVDTLWQTTGIALTSGTTYTLTATGTWSNASVAYTAAGNGSAILTGTNVPLSGQPQMALIGKIGASGTPFLVGASLTLTPGTTGVLYLAPQDYWYTTWDNAGSLSVSVCAGSGASCTYSLSPTSSGTVASTGGSGSFTVTTGTGCPWTPATVSSWIHITAGAGPSSGTVDYAVDSNSGASRSGTITVGDQTFTVSQAANASGTCDTVTVQARPTPPPGTGGTDTLWQSTGITLTAGQSVTITAPGTWTNGGVAYTAAGHASTTVTGTNCPLSGAPLMALVGRIGAAGTPFVVGPSNTFTAAATGVLYLAPQVNWYLTWDNSGSLSVTICR